MRGYPCLTDFFHSCLNQDFDLIGETLEEICAVYLKGAPSHEVSALLAEITTILDSADGPLDAFMEESFHPEVVLGAFAADARAFLVELRRLLSLGAVAG